MGTLTPNLGLYRPGGGSSGLITPDETADIDQLNANSDKIDAFAGSVEDSLEQIAFAEAVGQVTFAGSGGADSLNVAVTFPAGRFSVPPRVFCAPQVNSTGSALSVMAHTVTTSGFTARMGFPGGWSSSYTVPWHAVQMTSLAADG